MRHTTTVRRSFDAGHSVVGHSICRWEGHGHRWTIALTIAGGLDPKKVLVVDHGDLRAALNRVVDELAGHNLNDMLPGVITTPEGVGLYFRERLILEWPTIYSIQIEMGDDISVHLFSETR